MNAQQTTYSQAELAQMAIEAFREVKDATSFSARKTLFYKGWAIVVNGPVALHVQYSLEGKDFVYIAEL